MRLSHIHENDKSPWLGGRTKGTPHNITYNYDMAGGVHNLDSDTTVEVELDDRIRNYEPLTPPLSLINPNGKTIASVEDSWNIKVIEDNHEISGGILKIYHAKGFLIDWNWESSEINDGGHFRHHYLHQILGLFGIQHSL